MARDARHVIAVNCADREIPNHKNHRLGAEEDISTDLARERIMTCNYLHESRLAASADSYLGGTRCRKVSPSLLFPRWVHTPPYQTAGTPSQTVPAHYASSA